MATGFNIFPFPHFGAFFRVAELQESIDGVRCSSHVAARATLQSAFC
jgi:hypothetical protein